MFSTALPWLLWFLVLTAPLLIIGGVALRFGALPEKLGAALILSAALAALLVHLVLAEPARSMGLLVVDGALALGFLILAVVFASLWLGAAMLFQGVQFSLHAYYLVVGREHDTLYATVNNIVTYSILLFLLLGSLASWRRRRRAAEPAD